MQGTKCVVFKQNVESSKMFLFCQEKNINYII